MSIYLANSTDFETVANAIRTKGGTSAQLSFPDGMAAAVTALPGKMEWLDYYCKRITIGSGYGFFYGVDFSDLSGDVELSFPNVSNPDQAYARMFYYGVFSELDKLTINMKQATSRIEGMFSRMSGIIHHVVINGYKVYNMYLFGSNMDSNASIDHLTFNFDTSECNQYGGGLEIRGLKILDGSPLDLSLASQLTNNVFYATLEYIRIVPNTAKFQFTYFYNCDKLDDGSIVSIANSLDPNNPNSVRLHATVKSKCTTMMGTVNSDGLFVQDESGTVTLADFIQNTKGWTLA